MTYRNCENSYKWLKRTNLNCCVEKCRDVSIYLAITESMIDEVTTLLAIGCSALFAEISRVVFASAAAALIKRTAIDRVAVAYMESCE